jgi:transcriptional regulator with XRE-family HTH domain/mannose-6-phosphate isomerase-like protein (cupin superfamily)
LGHASVNVNIGSLVRRERERQRLSLRELSRRVGVSASMLSQVETGRTRPSVSTIYAIATELGLSIDALLSEDQAAAAEAAAAADAAPAAGHTRADLADGVAAIPPSQLVRPEDRRKLELESGVTWELLSDLLPHLVDFMLVTYEPGGRSSSSGKLTRHAGSEFAFMLRGTLKIQVGFDEYVLRPGDAMAFDSSEPHLLMNEGTEPAVGIWFVLGRRQAPESRAVRVVTDSGATVLRYPGRPG